MNRKPKVIVVGAGPAGSSTAAHLAASRRAEVVLLERGSIHEQKVCAGGLGPAALKELRQLDISGRVLGQAYPIRGLVLHTENGRRAVLRGPMSAAVLERSRFDSMLAEHAEQLGAEVIEGWKVTGLLTEGIHVRGVRGPGGAIEGDLVVLATGGTTSLSQGAYRRLLCIRRHVRGALHGKGLIELVVRRRMAPGYAWLFPEGNGLANIGLCLPAQKVQNRKSLSALMNDIQHRELAGSLSLADVGEDEFMGIRCSFRAKAPNRPGCWVTGEAAGLVNAVTGEGIGQAMASGRLAARAAAKLHDQNEETARKFYERSLDRHLTPALASAVLLGRLVSRPAILDTTVTVAKGPLTGMLSRLASVLASP